MGLLGSALRFKQMATPATPPAGESLLYPKADGQWYSKNSAGIEAPAIGRSEDTGWIPLPLINGWQEYQTTAYRPAYRRLNGVVYIRGLLKKASGVTTDVMFNLPAGFRPISDAIFSARFSGGDADLYIRPDGDVQTPGGSSTTWTSVQASFSVEQPTSFAIGDDTGWIAPTLQNGWVNYGQGWELSGYRRINGVTHLKGLITGSTTADPTVLFVLPVGFRPDSDKHFAVASGSAYGTIKVRANGNVTTATPISGAWASLANISFPTDSPPVAFVSAGDVIPKSETLGGVEFARNIVSGETLANGPRYMRINTTMRADAGLMPRFRIVGKTNAYEGAFEGHLTIYLYNIGGGTLYSPRWKYFGVAPGCWVSKDASNQLVIILDAPTASPNWHYGEVSVTEVANTYGTMTVDQTRGWTVTNTADTAGLSAVVQAT